MADDESVNSSYDGEQHVVLALQHLAKALLASKNWSSGMREVLADLNSQLSTMTGLTDSEAGLTSEIEDRLKRATQKIVSWQPPPSMICDSGPEDFAAYLQAVDEVRELTQSLESLLNSNNGKQKKELLDQAHVFLQMGMVRLEEELIHILAQSKQSFCPRGMASCSNENGAICEESIASTEGDPLKETPSRESIETESSECIIDLIHPDAVSLIKSIATVMFASNYDCEFRQAFTGFWKNALDECMFLCNVNTLTIEDVLQMDWIDLDHSIRTWCRAFRGIIRVYLAGEKQLFNQVLGGHDSTSSDCFVEASKCSMMSFLNFGNAVVLGPHLPERLFRVIVMYEVVADLLPDIDTLFSEEAGASIRIEFHTLLRRLGGFSKTTFLEFGHHVATKTSKTPLPKSGIHPLTKYVMNYFTTLAEYSDTLNFLLEIQDPRVVLYPVGDAENGEEEEDTFSCTFSPVACNLRCVTSILETNLENSSNLYKDDSLKHVFMMNNIHYIVEKVQNSKLRNFFGDKWIKMHIGKMTQHAMSYERATWSSVLCLLHGDRNPGKAILRERCRLFSIAFEDVYRSQTGCTIPDVKLREDLQISISLKVIHAYRTFTGKYSDSLGDKYIKYTAEHLENSILDLFEGTQKSMINTRRR